MLHCPNCRERLSSSEIGFGGLWSCLYCEGVWLPFQSVEAMEHSAGVNLTRYMAPTVSAASRRSDLVCPTCASTAFVSLEAKKAEFASCATCRGLFIPKATFDRFAEHLGVKQRTLLDFVNSAEDQTDVHPAAAVGASVAVNLLLYFLT